MRADALERANDALRARNAELEARLAPKAPLSEEEQARQRLEDAVKRERDEALARERAKRDEEELRELAKNRVAANVLQRRDAETLIVMMTLLAAVTAGAAGSPAGVGIVLAVAGVLLALVHPWIGGRDE
ncbi:MAG: hypothetical protein JO257_37575 [Deltaproteobacteria bacterium]|nr:hypothetical protein [Deltaproteobacteria bacterium]